MTAVSFLESHIFLGVGGLHIHETFHGVGFLKKVEVIIVLEGGIGGDQIWVFQGLGKFYFQIYLGGESRILREEEWFFRDGFKGVGFFIGFMGHLKKLEEA